MFNEPFNEPPTRFDPYREVVEAVPGLIETSASLVKTLNHLAESHAEVTRLVLQLTDAVNLLSERVDKLGGQVPDRD